MNSPVFTLGFPTDGTVIGGDTFTVDGWLDNPTATVTLTVVDGSGNASSYGGLVERTGRYWVENVPLSAGTNVFTLSVADAWGNSTMNSFTVVQSAMRLGGIGLPESTDLFQRTMTVSGWSSGGVAAVMSPDGWSWTATDVPNNDMGNGTVCFEMAAQDGANNLAVTSVEFDKPDHLDVDSYATFQTNSTGNSDTWYDGPAMGGG